MKKLIAAFVMLLVFSVSTQAEESVKGCFYKPDSKRTVSYNGCFYKLEDGYKIVFHDPVYYDGAKIPLCRDLMKILKLPENLDYLITSPKAVMADKKMRKMKKLHNPYLFEFSVGRELFIPATKKFSLFKLPVWEDVSEAEARTNLPKFIKMRDSYLVLGKDYKIQKAILDIDKDGREEVVYRSTGKGINELAMNENFPSITAQNVNQSRSRTEGGQIFIYGGRVYFLHNSDTRSLLVGRFDVPFNPDNNTPPGPGFMCEFHTIPLHAQPYVNQE